MKFFYIVIRCLESDQPGNKYGPTSNLSDALLICDLKNIAHILLSIKAVSRHPGDISSVQAMYLESQRVSIFQKGVKRSFVSRVSIEKGVCIKVYRIDSSGKSCYSIQVF